MGRAPCYNRDRNWSVAASNQGMSRIDSYHWKLGRGKNDFYPESQRKHGPIETLISDF